MLDKIKGYRGQVTPKEVERLNWLASQVPEGGLIVEIGAYRGKSGASLASGMKKGVKLMSIDPWIQLKTPTKQEYDTIGTVAEYDRNLKEFQPKVVQVIGYPNEVVHFIKGGIDLLFIDAVKNGVTPIWDNWLPKVKEGGWIASHDYDPRPESDQFYSEVVQVVKEKLIPITEDHHHIDFTWSGKLC